MSKHPSRMSNEKFSTCGGALKSKEPNIQKYNPDSRKVSCTKSPRCRLYSSHLNLRKVKLYEIKRPLILNENNYVLYFFCILTIKGAHFDLHFSGDIFLTDKHAIDNNPAHF